MIKASNADKIGEFSLTDKRFSRITKFMGETLYDEKMQAGRTEISISLGSSYHDAFGRRYGGQIQRTLAESGL